VSGAGFVCANNGARYLFIFDNFAIRHQLISCQVKLA